jgi:hypothetical protein
VYILVIFAWDKEYQLYYFKGMLMNPLESLGKAVNNALKVGVAATAIAFGTPESADAQYARDIGLGRDAIENRDQGKNTIVITPLKKDPVKIERDSIMAISDSLEIEKEKTLPDTSAIRIEKEKERYERNKRQQEEEYE